MITCCKIYKSVLHYIIYYYIYVIDILYYCHCYSFIHYYIAIKIYAIIGKLSVSSIVANISRSIGNLKGRGTDICFVNCEQVITSQRHTCQDNSRGRVVRLMLANGISRFNYPGDTSRKSFACCSLTGPAELIIR